MKRIPILILLLSVFTWAVSQRNIINVPDIPGYKTMVCDFHLHTVFSDGNVWPTVRVDEAIREGLDAIAITDHLEYRPHDRDMDADRNRSWQIAKEYAADKGLIVIAGTEITKGMPPGHFNALFIRDAIPILNKDFRLAMNAAADQGAFIMWNHPGWKAQQPDSTVWWAEHSYILEQGWMHGIEVINGPAVAPEAISWANQKGLAMIGSSDQHGPFMFKEFDPEDHRTSTLVFVAEESEGGIREALFNGRTACWYKDGVIGKAPVIRALFLASVTIRPLDVEKGQYIFYNPTDLELRITLSNTLYEDWSKEIKLQPGSKTIFKIPPGSTGEQIGVRVNNMLSGVNEPIEVPLSMIQSVHQ